MKRLLLAAIAVFSLAAAAGAAENVIEAPVGFVGGPFAITVSGTAWTQVYKSTAAVTGKQNGIVVNNPSANTNSMGCVIADSAPSVSTTTYSIEIQKGENPVYPIPSGMFLYCVDLGGTAERVFAQFLRQQP